MFTVFSESVMYRYKCGMCSKGTLFVLFIALLTVAFPLMFTYKSHGFWKKTDTYQEKPDVRFKYEYLFILQTERFDSPIICSSYDSLSYLNEEKNSCPIVKVREEDFNKDGYNDVLYFDLEVILDESTANIFGLTLILLFDYKLYGHCYLDMDSFGIIQEMTSVPAARFDYIADLQLVQNRPLHTKYHHVFYKQPIIDSKDFNIINVIKEYGSRNVSTRLVNNYAVWSYGRANSDPFVVSVQINYPSTTVLYKPEFWQEIKWAWTQYFPVLLPFILIFREVKRFIFSNHVIHTVRNVPWLKNS